MTWYTKRGVRQFVTKCCISGGLVGLLIQQLTLFDRLGSFLAPSSTSATWTGSASSSSSSSPSDDDRCLYDFSVITHPSEEGKFLLELLSEIRGACPRSAINVFTSQSETDHVTEEVISDACQLSTETEFCPIKLLYYTERVPGFEDTAVQGVNYWRALRYHGDHQHRPLVLMEDDIHLSKRFANILDDVTHMLRRSRAEEKSFLLNLYNPDTDGPPPMSREKKCKAQRRMRRKYSKDVVQLPCVYRGQYNYGTQAAYFSSTEITRDFASFLRGLYFGETPGMVACGFGDMLLRTFFFDDNECAYTDPTTYEKGRNAAFPSKYDMYSIKFSLVEHRRVISSVFGHGDRFHEAIDFIDDFPHLLRNEACDGSSGKRWWWMRQLRHSSFSFAKC